MRYLKEIVIVVILLLLALFVLTKRSAGDDAASSMGQTSQNSQSSIQASSSSTYSGRGPYWEEPPLAPGAHVDEDDSKKQSNTQESSGWPWPKPINVQVHNYTPGTAQTKKLTQAVTKAKPAKPGK